MTESISRLKQSAHLKRTVIFLSIAWTVSIISVLGWHLWEVRKNTLKLATIEASHSFEKDLVYRRWNAGHGGLYVPVTKTTPPNPYLSHIGDRDIMTTSGKSLTLMNPAYMTRQVHELGKRQYGHQGHITSLNPIRPENAPDSWEIIALQAFEHGQAEVVELAKIGGEEFLRLMRPMITESVCLRCHAQQGYHVGDVRGGISVSIPMAERLALMFSHMHMVAIGYLFIWLLGLVGIGFGSSRISSRIFEQERAERALRRSEELLAETGRIAKIGGWEIDHKTHEMVWTEEVYRIYELSLQDKPSIKKMIDFAHPDNCHELEKAIQDALKYGSAYDVEILFITKRGRNVWARIICKPVIEHGEVIRVAGTLQDITQLKREEGRRKELEVQLHQKYKMEAVGVMAGGIAHNFNNNLSIILGNIELSRTKLPADSVVVDYLKNAKIAIHRSRDLTKQILTYSRQNMDDKMPISLSVVVNETIDLLRSTFPSTVNLQQNTCNISEDITIDASSSKIQECLINLCNNAVHAMDEKGDLFISLASVVLKQTDISAQYKSKPGHYAKLSVQDNGIGMSGETVKKIFDLFFTTKPVDEGTGVGLSTVQGVVDQCGGLIKVDSTLGEGTTFELFFPIYGKTTAGTYTGS